MDAKNISLQIKRDDITECSRHPMTNVSEKKFTLSKQGSTAYIVPSELYFDGENADLVIKAPIEKYISKEFLNNPDFFPKESDFTEVPMLREMTDAQEREQYGKTIEEMDGMELFDNGLITPEEMFSATVLDA